MKNQRKSESGQALVLIVLGIVGLLGFAALAIDGGRVYSDRRNMQNASDTASLTGAGSFAKYMSENAIYWRNFDCSGSWFISASAYAYSDAINRADLNGYSIDTTINDPLGANGIVAVCGQTVYVGFTDKYIDVTTYVTSETPPTFSQFVFGGALRQTVESTARIRPQASATFGNAIVALNPAACSGNSNGAIFDGNDTIQINGGGVFSNGCMSFNGTSLSIDVINGVNTYVGNLTVSGSPSVSPAPAQGNEELPDDIYQISPPNCTGLPNLTITGPVMLPGNYSASTITGGPAVTMLPGLYCFNGTFKITGGTIQGDGVTIFMKTGDFELGGGSTANLSAPNANPDPSPAIPNLVIYMAQSNSGVVSLLGTPSSSFLGTIYAPKGTVNIGGNAGVNPTYTTQIIAWNVKVNGNATVNINFVDNYAYQLPPRLDLQK